MYLHSAQLTQEGILALKAGAAWVEPGPGLGEEPGIQFLVALKNWEGSSDVQGQIIPGFRSEV